VSHHRFCMCAHNPFGLVCQASWLGRVFTKAWELDTDKDTLGSAFPTGKLSTTGAKNKATNTLGISSSGGVVSPAKAARWKAVSSGIVMWRRERGGSLGFYSPRGFSWRRVDRWAFLPARTGKPYWTRAERAGLWLSVSAVLACRLH